MTDDVVLGRPPTTTGSLGVVRLRETHLESGDTAHGAVLQRESLGEDEISHTNIWLPDECA